MSDQSTRDPATSEQLVPEVGRKLRKKKKSIYVPDSFLPGDVEIVGADKINSDGYFMLSKYIARKTSITAAAKLVWSVIIGFAWNDKYSSFPGQALISKEAGISLRTVYRAILQLSGENKDKEVFLRVIHRGHGLTNLYRIYFKMPRIQAERVRSKKKS